MERGCNDKEEREETPIIPTITVGEEDKVDSGKPDEDEITVEGNIEVSFVLDTQESEGTLEEQGLSQSQESNKRK